MPNNEKNILENNPTLDAVKSKFGESLLKSEVFRNELTLYIKRESIAEIMAFLKNDSDLAYDMLNDVTVVDGLIMEKNPRFQVVYHLRSTKYNRRLRIKAPVPENDCKIATVSHLWKLADWAEREAYEMYGVTFEGHPDLRRLLTPASFTNFPLRKDYPLRGKGERDVILPEGS